MLLHGMQLCYLSIYIYILCMNVHVRTRITLVKNILIDDNNMTIKIKPCNILLKQQFKEVYGKKM